jgi:AraC-like DNA-binding protein
VGLTGRNDPHVDLLDLTHRFGYYDYSHFTKDFQKFYGQTPHDFKQWVIQQQKLFAGQKRDVAFLQEEEE